jgi:pimeloyl-ACP methyl ester carboxylesterase
MQVTFYHNNKNLHYHTQGDGMPVMLIHGLAEDHSIWDETASDLSSKYRLILPDLPGSGFSELTAVLSIESMAEACKAILDKEDCGPCAVIGHSMGGYVALALAEKYPDSISALGLFHSSAFADDEEKIASRKKNISFILSHGTSAFMQQATPTLFSSKSKEERPEMINYLINKYSDFNAESLVAYQQAMIKRPDRSAVLEEIVKPVLFIIGKEDKAIPYQLSMRQSHLPAIAFIHVLEHSGHMGMMEEFEESLEILEKFLEELQRRQS